MLWSSADCGQDRKRRVQRVGSFSLARPDQRNQFAHSIVSSQCFPEDDSAVAIAFQVRCQTMQLGSLGMLAMVDQSLDDRSQRLTTQFGRKWSKSSSRVN